ncbi:MAG TPA: hypothetical protein VE642_08375 [Pyrinomonadaceae bacterium]|jgi:hypothetical protein|nr:hypothetical protein [Pyrinomonadaceae bacterium]
MSKEISSRKLVSRASAAALAALALLSGPGAGAQRAKPAAVNPKTAAVREATAEVLQETSEIRKLAILRPVQSGAQSRAEIEQMLVRNLDESATPEELRASEAVMKKLGLAPADFQLRPFIIKLLAEQVAGYYEPKTREFYLADWIDLDGQKPVMAHELTHALQDQHFDLRRFENWPKHDSDAELATHSLVEGDASFLMMQYIVRNPARQLAFIKSMGAAGASATEQIDKAPRFLRETLVFPYFQGMAWVAGVYKQGGWDAVSAAYKNLPKSTEQILHNDKYAAGEAPQKVTLLDISASLGRGWKMADNDVQGEWGYYLLLDQILQSPDVSKKASAGWGGDRYALFTGPNPADVLVAQKAVWDTEQDAREFFDAYVARTTKRYGVEPATQAGPGRVFWKTPEGGALVELSGSTVLVLEGVPAGADARALAAAL